MDANTYDSIIEFPCLGYINENISKLKKSEQSYWGKFFTNFNKLCNKISKIEDDELLFYLYRIIMIHYYNKLAECEKKYDKKLISYIKNYVHARLLIIGKSRNIFK
jgi:hypothetical protein